MVVLTKPANKKKQSNPVMWKGSRARQVASSKITDSKIAEDEDGGRGFLEE